jgi:hypothetical protein
MLACDILSIRRQFVPAQRAPVRPGYGAFRKKALGHSRWRKILSSIVEGSMPAREGEELRYPTVEFVLHTVAGGINKHRANGGRDELGQCNPEDAIQIAKDLGVPVGDLQGLIAKGATAANALPKMLSALFVDAQAPTDGDPAVMRDLQRTCILLSPQKPVPTRARRG